MNNNLPSIQMMHLAFQLSFFALGAGMLFGVLKNTLRAGARALQRLHHQRSTPEPGLPAYDDLPPVEPETEPTDSDALPGEDDTWDLARVIATAQDLPEEPMPVPQRRKRRRPARCMDDDALDAFPD